MAALNFPNSPSTNDIHTENGVSFKWNGTIWKRVSAAYTDATNLNVTGISTFAGNINANGNIVGDNSTNISGINDVIATSFVGGLPITSGGSWRVVTSSNASTLKGEENLQFDGTNLYISDGIKHKDDSNTKIGFPAADTFAVDTSGYERLRIDSTGKVSIGNLASPDSLLHVHNGSAGSITGSSSANITIESSGSYNVLQFLSPSTAAQQIRFGDTSDHGAGYIEYNHNGNALTFGVNGPEKLRITSDGLVKWAGHTLSARNSATGVAGGMIYNTDAKVFQYYDGSGWQTITSNSQIVATGGNSVSTSSGYRIHDFQSNGTFEITSGVGEVEILVVGGGGSEGGDDAGCHAGGGGGGGGVVYQKRILYPGKYNVVVGAGGNWRNNGSNSVFGNNWAHSTIYGFGGGAGGPTLTGNGNSGGSGGGGSRHTTTNQGGAGIQPTRADGGFGNAGGDTGNNTATGGGGGAGGAGQDGDAGNPGRGGAGKQFTQFGVTIYFGAGGNAQGTHTSEGQTATSSNGAGNTGAGGGGSPGGGTRYSGGSGRVMVRYPAAS